MQCCVWSLNLRRVTLLTTRLSFSIQTARTSTRRPIFEGSPSSYSQESCPPVYHTSPPRQTLQTNPIPSRSPLKNQAPTTHHPGSLTFPRLPVPTPSASTSLLSNLHPPIQTSEDQSSVASLSKGIANDPFPPLSNFDDPPSQRKTQLFSPSSHADSESAISLFLASTSSPHLNETLNSSPPRLPPPSQPNFNWLSSSPTGSSNSHKHSIQPQTTAPPLPPNSTLSSSPSQSTSTLTFLPPTIKTSPRLLYPLKSCLKPTHLPNPPPNPSLLSSATKKETLPSTKKSRSTSTSSSDDVESPPPSSGPSKRRRSALEPVFDFEPTPIGKPEGYKLPGRLVKRTRA